jgi:hypothetical protein
MYKKRVRGFQDSRVQVVPYRNALALLLRGSSCISLEADSECIPGSLLRGSSFLDPFCLFVRNAEMKE